MIKTGLIAAVPVAIVCALFLLVRADAIKEEVKSDIKAVGFSGQNPLAWIGLWSVIAIAFGVFATWVYTFLVSHWNWGPTQYLTLAAVLATVLSVLAFLKIYNGEMHPFRYEWIGLNYAFAVGFGYLIPRMVM